MPAARISDDELRRRLEEHSYNVPPITDTTRSVLVRKLKQLDLQRRQRPAAGIDYSSAEEDFTPPASSTKKRASVGGRARPGARNGHSAHSAAYREETPPYKPAGSSGRHVRNGGIGSLINQSEEEEDSDEVEEDSDEKFEEYDEEEIITSRADLAIQTSFGSPESESRFRGKTVSPSSGLSSPSQPYTIKSQHLRQNLDKFGSLNEALSTMPSNKQNITVAAVPRTPISPSPSPLTQVSRPSPARNPYERKENAGNSMFISSLIILFAALFFVFLGYQYFNLRSDHTHQKIPLCIGAGDDVPNVTCIPGNQLNGTAQLLEKLLKIVKGENICKSSNERPFPSLKETLQLEQTSTDEFENNIRNVLILLKQNPSWGIQPVYKEDEVTHLAVVETSVGVVCWAEYLVYLVVGLLWRAANYILLVAAVGGAAWAGYTTWRRRREQRQRQRKEMFHMVERVLALLHDHHYNREGYSNSYLAIDHIRDQIIPPQEREARFPVWRQVLDYMRHHESRVREEIQHIHGEEFRVWQWLPDIAPSSGPSPPHRQQPPVPRPPPPGSPRPSGHPSPGRDSSAAEPWPFVPTSSPGSPGWQGSAFQLNRHVSAPSDPPTSCLKVRYMFDPHRQESADWVNGLKRDIVSRCSEAKILHIAVDRGSREGVVYIKTVSTENAGIVFNCLHGQWYKGKLVTAKYLTRERYHQRFPDSANLEVPLSNR